MTSTSVGCGSCSVGPWSVYGPAFADSPKLVSEYRIAVRQFKPRQVIVPAGMPVESAMTLREGWACRFKLLPDGQRHILSFLIPGDTILLEHLIFPHFVPPYATKALTPVTACLFGLGDYQRIATCSPSQREHFRLCIQHYGAALHRRQVDLGRRSATARICQLLLEIEARLAERKLVDDGTFSFPLGQREISDATGVTTSHVNRVFSRLRETGVIQTGPKRLTICDRQRLKELGEGD